MTLINFALLSVVFLDLALGFLVLLHGKKSLNSIFFAILSFSSSIWTLTNFMTGFYPDTFWLQSTYAMGAIVISSALIWILLLVDGKVSKKASVLIIFFAMVLFFGSFYTGFIAQSYTAIYSGGAFVGTPGVGLWAYTLLFLLASLLAFYKLLRGYRVSQTKEKKDQFIFIFYGCLVTISISFLTSFLFPIFSVYQFAGIDSIGFLVFLSCIAYAILKHQLFDIKVIATELVTLTVWIILFIKIFFSGSFEETIVNSVIFASLVFFGILLIRSVLKEVHQREQIEQLAKELQRAYQVEKQAKEELEKLDKFKDQFLMTTQHNLRTPLTSMRGYSDLLLNGTFGKQPKKTVEVIGKLKVLTDGMIKMVNDFLDMAKFQLGKDVVAVKPGIELLLIVEEIIGELEFGAKQKNVELKFEKPSSPIIISADREKLKAALFNIVDNSIKYTPQGSVTVTVSQGDVAKITVTDTGIGITKERLATLFESMFERGSRASKVSTTGSGIGLYLSGQIIKSHKGKVWAESEGEGKGSVFHIELPLS